MAGFHWMRKTDPATGAVVYKVINAYHGRGRLREFGFDFDRRRKVWLLELPAGDTSQRDAVESYLRVVEEESL